VAKRLTDVAIRNLKPRTARYEVPDRGARGLYVTVQPSGRKGYCVRFRFEGQPRKLTLQPGIALSAARKLCGDAMLQVAQGIDPARAKKEAKRRAANAKKGTLRAVCEEYFAQPEAKALRTHRERRRLMERLVLSSPLASHRVDGITRPELVKLLDTIQANNGTRSADMALGILRRIFGRYALNSESFNNPIIPEMTRYKYSEHARARVLSDSELRSIWLAADCAGTYGSLIKFLLLTTCRLREAAHMRWSELLDGDVWELPKERNKVKTQPLARPLPAAVRDLLATLLRIDDCPFVFTVNGTRPISGFSWRKKRFDKICGVQGWVVHDLRRTSRSLLSRCGVPVDHAERVLGHVIGGVRGVYDRYAFHNEKKQALEALAAQIDRIIKPQSNVIAIRG
jgi:integrase